MHLRALTALNCNADKWDALLIHIITSKLDTITSREWHASLRGSELPTFKELINFLSHRSQILEEFAKKNSISSVHSDSRSQSRSNVGRQALHTTIERGKCNCCAGEHLIYFCREFLKLPINQRIAEMCNRKMCFNCLHSQNHVATKCPSGSCRTCNLKHNTLLHISKSDGETGDAGAFSASAGSTHSVHQDMKEKENISPLKNSEDNSTNKLLFHPGFQLTDDSIDAEANNVLQIVETNEMIPTGPLQSNLDEDTIASNANVYATEATQSVSLSTINDNDCLDVSSDIPDVFKKTLFWPRTNNSAAKKRAVKVKLPSVVTSIAWQEYHQAKETEKSQHLIAVEERKKKRQEMAEKKKTRSRGKEKTKNVATSRKSYQKNNNSSRRKR